MFSVHRRSYLYPETAQKSLEEIEQLFKHGGPKPWNTMVGGSRLEAHIQAVIDDQRKSSLQYDEHGAGIHYGQGSGADEKV